MPEGVHLLQPPQVPRLLYALSALEYRSWQLLPTLLDLLDANMHVSVHGWRAPQAAACASALRDILKSLSGPWTGFCFRHPKH